MASGANQVPLGRLNLKATAPVKSSLLKPEYVSSRFSDSPNGNASRSPSMEKRSSTSSDRDRERPRDHDDYEWKEKSYKSSRDLKDEYPLKRPSRFSDTKEPVVKFKEESPEPGKKKRKSRWAEPTEQRAFIPGMPTIIPAHLTKEQEQTYLLQLQIEDISRKLRTGDLGIPADPEKRSPSPEPIYNHEGKRLNTRDMRTRKKLEDERHALIQEMFKINIDYKPPPDYKAPLAKFTDKVLIPQDDHPEINFVGLLIGPRGNTLKALEKDSGTKIIIRGKGSVKEGKIGRPNRDPLPGEDEPLHAYITGQTPEAVKGSVERIKKILMEGIEVPEHQNDLRKQQLRELALLHGTLRDDAGPRCSNCGSTAHRSFNCPDKPNITHSVICTRCGGTGHIAKDCKTDLTKEENIPNANMDDEYLSLMAELGQGPPPASKNKPVATSVSTQSYGAVPPPGMQTSQTYGAPPPPPTYPSGPQQQHYNHWGAPPPAPNAYPTWGVPPPPPPCSQYPQMVQYAPLTQYPPASGQYPWSALPPPPPPPPV